MWRGLKAADKAVYEAQVLSPVSAGQDLLPRFNHWGGGGGVGLQSAVLDQMAMWRG